MKKLQGIPVSPGVAIGPAFILKPPDLSISKDSDKDPEMELKRIQNAIETARKKIASMHEKAKRDTSSEHAGIFEAHSLILDDPSLLEMVKKKLVAEKINAETALSDVFDEYVQKLEALDNEYFQARSIDIIDVKKQLIGELLGISNNDLLKIEKPVVLVASDLSPSETIQLDKDLILAICTAHGGPTSHSAILSKSLGIPAVVGVGQDCFQMSKKRIVFVDGNSGEIIIDPDDDTQKKIQIKLERVCAESKLALENAKEPAITIDGRKVEIVANIGSINEARYVIDYGGEGIGLLRTEFLYLKRETAPSEEEQYQAYNEIFRLIGDRPVVARTLDIGGDKKLPYFDLGEEANPFLGWRGIRICLDNPDILRIQLRAILRAGSGRDLRIMFPMIANLEEVQQAKRIFQETHDELIQKGLCSEGRVQVGIMVEIPSVAILAEKFAKEVDFFSIGTNDLTQYTFAAERTNHKVSYLCDACHPAILKQIQWIINAAHRVGKWVGMCGELAGDPDAIPILLGLGLDEFSMAPSQIPQAKMVIRRWKEVDAQKLASNVLNYDSAESVRNHVKTYKQSPI
jgi:phosphoenolpyruvate-protein phosphotransferase (PTS system enzyme I)